MREKITLYHVTNPEAAEAILRGGFRDGEGSYMTDHTFQGVWLSDRPLDINEGVRGEQVLEVSLPSDFDLNFYEWVEDGPRNYREWLIPAALINTCGTLKLAEELG